MIRGVLHAVGDRVVNIQDQDTLRPPSEGVLWIDIVQQTLEDLDLLKQRFSFHPLALEDCEHLNQRPKLEQYEDHYFLVIHGFRPCEQTGALAVEYQELHCFLGPGYLVSIHLEAIPALDDQWRRCQEEPGFMARGMDLVFASICSGMVDANFAILDELSDRIEDLEAQVIVRDAPLLVSHMMRLKRSLLMMRRVLSPQRDVINELLRHDLPLVTRHTVPYLRDVYDHLIRLLDMIDNFRDLVSSTREAHFSVVSQRTNEIMKRLTLVNLIFMPLSFLTGFFGMNFTHLPIESLSLMLTVTGACLVLPLGLIVWFREKRWFG